MVWALRGATDADVVVPAEFVSICNNEGPFGLATVTDRDKGLTRCRKISICNIWKVKDGLPVTDLDISRMSLGWDCNAFRSPCLILFR